MNNQGSFKNEPFVRLEGYSETHWVDVTLEDDAGGVAGRGATLVSVLVDNANGAILRHLRAGPDISQVVTGPINFGTSTQRTHCRREQLNEDTVSTTVDWS